MKSFILVVSIILLFALIVFFMQKTSTKDSEIKEQALYKVLGNLHFKGKVINFSVINRYEKKYSMLCIKLDYTNIDSVYYFENDYCIIIKDAIATLPGGLIINNKIIDYVEVNIDSKKKVIYHYNDGSIDEYNYFSNAGWLIKSDVNACK